MKLDSLVIADQLCCGEYVLESCTHNKSAQQPSFLSGLNPLLSVRKESIANGSPVTARCWMEDLSAKDSLDNQEQIDSPEGGEGGEDLLKARLGCPEQKIW